MKIFVCDDSKSVHNMLNVYLEDTGFEIMSFYSAIDLILHIESGNHADQVLLDWEMPELTGLSALQFIRNSGIGIPIIMLTGKNTESDIREALKSGANSYILKPFTKDIVLNSLKSTH